MPVRLYIPLNLKYLIVYINMQCLYTFGRKHLCIKKRANAVNSTCTYLLITNAAGEGTYFSYLLNAVERRRVVAHSTLCKFFAFR